MDRKGHYLKPGTKPTAPNVVFAVVMSPTIVETRGKHAGYWESWGGADVCCSKYRRGRWSMIRGARAETPDELHDWMAKHADRAARNYVVTPDGAGSLAVGQVWDHLCTAPVKWRLPGTVWSAKTIAKFPHDTTWVRRCTLTPRCLIFDYSRRGVRWVWLNGHQHLGMTEGEIGRTIGAPWEDTGEYDPADATEVHTSQARAVLWCRAYQHLSDWWRSTAKAPFGLTAASMAIGVLRTHIRNKQLCTHANPAAHELEREACYGGSLRTWFFGDIGNPRRFSTAAHPAPPRSCYGTLPGPLHQLDVRSMYPWLLRERRYPTRIADVYYRMHPSDLLHWCRTLAVLARVTVETDVPEYPLRTKTGIEYPVGRFTTVLTGPELLRIAAEGRIAHVHYVVTYLTGTPFRDAAAALIRMRDSARDETNPGWGVFAKQVAVSLAGKLAQKRGEWHELEDYPPTVQFGEWTEAAARGRRRRRFRSMAGLVWEFQPDASGAGPYTAAFAYLCAYGRMHMRSIRDECPRGSVVSMDTDGLWVFPDAVAACRRLRQAVQAEAGDLCVKHTSKCGRFFGPKHYFLDSGWVLAGFSEMLVKRSGREVADVRRHTPIAGPLGAPPRGTSVEHRTSALVLSSAGVSIGPDGWAEPRRKGPKR